VLAVMLAKQRLPSAPRLVVSVGRGGLLPGERENAAAQYGRRVRGLLILDRRHGAAGSEVCRRRRALPGAIPRSVAVSNCSHPAKDPARQPAADGETPNCRGCGPHQRDASTVMAGGRNPHRDE